MTSACARRCQRSAASRRRATRIGRDPAAALGYVELHIEQGPVLEREGLPVGVVTAINGASRFAVIVDGVAGHAGTVPMDMRHDALAAAAEMVMAVQAPSREPRRDWSARSGISRRGRAR